jgi:hypothetical protein
MAPAILCHTGSSASGGVMTVGSDLSLAGLDLGECFLLLKINF